MDKAKPYSGPPILSFVGNSGSGKTAYLEKLIPLLKAKGLRLGIVKSDAHDFDIDIPGKDSWRFTQAGADITVIASPQKMALIEKWEEKENLEQLALRIKNADLILSEGFRRDFPPKIEIRRAACGHEKLFEQGQLFAVVTDIPESKVSRDDSVVYLPLDDPQPLVELITKYIKTYNAGR